jgi:hypothetical protein
VYEVVALLGAGGMGEVYRARDTRLNRDVAIKILPVAFAAEPDRLARFEREARVLAALNHPNIATIHGIEAHGGVQALVMELVEGETLRERLAGSPGRGLPLPTVRLFGRQLADALDAAHEKGIVHRDLKPANIQITADDVVKVLDFGLAKAIAGPAGPDASDGTTIAEATQVGQVVGTIAYMSPEQARGQVVDKRTDIWAFGCVLYEMITGRRAFAGESAGDTMAAILRPDVDLRGLPGDTPPNVRRLIERCLATNVKRRMRDIGDARQDLDESSDTASSVRPGVSRRGVLGAAGLGLIGAGLAGAGIVGGMALAGPSSPATTPVYRRLTYRRGMIRTARFAPDYQTVLYGALWDGDVCRTYMVRPESPESSALALPPAMPLAISASGEMALALGTHLRGGMPYGTLARVPIAGGAPREELEGVRFADWSRDGRELAIVRRDGDRDVLEFPMGTVIAGSATAGGFSFPRISPRGDAVAVFELEAGGLLSGNVAIIDRAGVKRATSKRSVNCFGLAWKGDDEVWFTAAEELPLLRNAVHGMTTKGEARIVARVPGNVSLHDISPDGRILIARTDDRGGISVFAPGDTVERDFSWLDSPVLGDISSDGKRILFSENGVGGGPRGSVYLREVDGSQAKRLGDGRALALSPDGKWAITRTGSPHLDLIPTGAGQARRLERSGLTLTHARWFPDGLRVLVRAEQADRRARLYALTVDSQDVVPVTPEELAVGSTGWALSPEGTRVAVNTPRGIELYPVPGGPARRIPGLAAEDRVLAWMTSGLLVSPDPPAAGSVFRIDPASGRRELWRDIQPRDPTGIMNLSLTTLVITPDGRSYGYYWHRAISDLYLVEGWS